jgi:hypothetical protein
MNKDILLGYKTIKIYGNKYIIRKINPLLDFPYDKMPQIFTSFYSKRPVDINSQIHPAQLQNTIEMMKQIVESGLIKPVLIPIGKNELRHKEAGITIDDIFVDMDLGTKLYLEILAHSLNKFRHGIIEKIKGVFFSIRIKHLLYIACQKNIDKDRLMSYFQKAVIR